jgi:cytochrome b
MESGENRVKVWDAPVRLFHWLLVVLVAVSIGSGLYGGNAMKWHALSGYALLTLVVFRLGWGLVGSTTARFSDFLYGPRHMLAFARGIVARRATAFAGHNPLGGWMVLVLLLCVLFQASTGLFANDDIATEGPLYGLIGKDLSDRLTSWHRINIKILYGLVALHVAAVLFHRIFLKEDLVDAMITGYKKLPDGSSAGRIRFASTWLALGLFMAAAVGTWLLVNLSTI